MKITRRRFLAASSAACVLAKSELALGSRIESFISAPVSTSAAGEVTVYTTADNSEQRLSETGKLAFKPMGQPLETQICVFVDPSRTFQTILGIGGALTDAAAETFAKLPETKQQEIINAYFDAGSGLGYTLARTNIH